MPETRQEAQVAIVGGGLAGLTLAIQLKQASPALDIVVLERDRIPPPAAAHKVGESTVEIGAHYLSHTLGLRDLLENTQLRKFGLRFFFGDGTRKDLAEADELGTSAYFCVPSYQLDRGTLEGSLAEIGVQLGVRLMRGCTVQKLECGARGIGHELQFSDGQYRMVLKCRWLVDAASRASVLRRELQLGRPSAHQVNAAWMRLDKSIDIDDWSGSADWKQRCNGHQRRYSTNHLMGPGYWAWIIPLPGNRSSIGLVADPNFHALEAFNSPEHFVRWMSVYQPLLASQLAASRGELMDFRFLRQLAHGCKQNWSANQWALTGEAGVFTDPFYSPGSDFIAIGNSLVCDLVTQHRPDAEARTRAAIYDKVYKSFFASTLSLYREQYPGFGDARLMVLKSTWDYAYYWSVLAWLYFRGLLTDLEFLRDAEAALVSVRHLNETMQSEFRKRASAANAATGRGRFFDQCAIPVLAELNAGLLEPTGNVEHKLAENCARLQALAPLLLGMLDKSAPRGRAGSSLLGDLHSRLT